MNNNDDENHNRIHGDYYRALRGGNEKEIAQAEAALTAHHRQSEEQQRDLSRNQGMERIRNHMQEVKTRAAQNPNVLVEVLQELTIHGHDENSLSDQLDMSTIYDLLQHAPALWCGGLSLGGNNAVGEMEDGNRSLNETRGYLQRNRRGMQIMDTFAQLSCARELGKQLRMSQLVVKHTMDVNDNIGNPNIGNVVPIGNANIVNLRQAILENRLHFIKLMDNFLKGDPLTGDLDVLFATFHESDEIYFQLTEELLVLEQAERLRLQNAGNPNGDNNNGGV